MKSEFYYELVDKYGKLDILSNDVKSLFYEIKKLETSNFIVLIFKMSH